MTAASRPRLLFVAFYFPPTRASGVFRSRAVANHLAAQGWDVTVVTPQRSFFTHDIRSVDPSLEATVDPSVTVERVHFPSGAFTRDLRTMPWSRAMVPKLDARVRAWRDARRFPDAYAAWIEPVVKAGRRLHRSTPFDAVLATGNPFSSFEIARRLGHVLQIPYVLDYRDAWTLDQFAAAPRYEPDHRVWEAEERVITEAARVIFVNEAQRTWHAERYPAAAERMRVVENGWDEELLAEGLARPVAPAGGTVHFGYIGTITRHVPVHEFAAGWRLAVESGRLRDARATLYGYLGFFTHTAESLRDALPFDDELGLHYGGTLPKDEVGPTFASLDVLLLLTPSSPFITCQKVYEYLAFGKPMVSVNEPDCDARTPLIGHPLSFPVPSMAPQDVADQLVTAADAARRLTPADVSAARQLADAHTRAAHLAPLDDILLELVGAR